MLVSERDSFIRLSLTAASYINTGYLYITDNCWQKTLTESNRCPDQKTCCIYFFSIFFWQVVFL